MFYSPLVYKAMKIAYDAHDGVYDKSGAPYIFHPFTVASDMDDEIATCVALLHDVVEDTDVTFDDLRSQGMPESVIGPLGLMTHDDDSPYMEYIERIGTDPVATRVKLADLEHNMNRQRYCRPLNDYELQREQKYQRAKDHLLSRRFD